jgi:hypothetical protein
MKLDMHTYLMGLSGGIAVHRNPCVFNKSAGLLLAHTFNVWAVCVCVLEAAGRGSAVVLVYVSLTLTYF